MAWGSLHVHRLALAYLGGITIGDMWLESVYLYNILRTGRVMR